MPAGEQLEGRACKVCVDRSSQGRLDQGWQGAIRVRRSFQRREVESAKPLGAKEIIG